MYSEDPHYLSIDDAHGECVRHPLDNAREIGCYSVDKDDEVRYNRSQMKYCIELNKIKFPLDLNAGYRGVQQSHDGAKTLNNLLRWIEHSGFEPLQEYSIHFVCTRGVIRSLLNTPYNTEKWIICACRLGETIYLNFADRNDCPERKISEDQKRHDAWGIKFEQYMTADRPNGIPAVTPITHQKEKFYSVIKNRIGSHNLLISAEIDGINRLRHDSGDQDPSCYVEMKISKWKRNFVSSDIFQSYKSRDWWAQSVCSGTGKIICGLRDDKGIVGRRDIKVFNPNDLPSLCKDRWLSGDCINFCHNVLDYLRKKLTVNDPRIACRCEYTGKRTVSVSWEKNPTSPFNLIPDWYERELRKRSSTNGTHSKKMRKS